MLLQVEKLTKQFSGMYALKDVCMGIEAGEVHGLVGENGAGKSTLIKILTGVYHLDSGSVLWNGEEVHLDNPRQSRALGINVIHQDRHLIPCFNGIENVFLGLAYEKKTFGAVDWKKMHKRVEALAAQLGINVNLNLPASRLTPPQRTLIEILRAMMTECKLLVLDEPTASLTDKETDLLFGAIESLRRAGTAILYVTHRMDEIFQLTDRITVMKNGQCVNTVNTKDVDKDQLIGMMTDNWTSESLTTAQTFGDEILRVEGLGSQDGIVKDMSFSLHQGEILGVFGLGGSGRTEALECLYGYRPAKGGCVTLAGKTFDTRTPAASLANGMVLICEDRRGMALVTSLNVRENTTLSTINHYAHLGVVSDAKQIKDTNDKIQTLAIKTTGSEQRVEQLSGGNQQKVVFAKALMSKPRVMLCDEPTQAVDVKTRKEIHKLLRTLADSGSGVVVVSSDLKEVLEVADNVAVVAGGRTLECFENSGLTAEKVLARCYEH